MMALVLTDFASNIGKRAFMKMRTLEGSNSIAMKTSNVSLESRAKKSNMSSFGETGHSMYICRNEKIYPGNPIIDRLADLGRKL